MVGRELELGCVALVLLLMYLMYLPIWVLNTYP